MNIIPDDKEQREYRNFAAVIRLALTLRWGPHLADPRKRANNTSGDRLASGSLVIRILHESKKAKFEVI